MTPRRWPALNAALVLTLRGTPFLYNGEEIGMTDLIITDPAKLRDTMATWYYDAAVNDLEVDPDEAAARAAGRMTRDKNRTPMQWSDQPNAGFCPGGGDALAAGQPELCRWRQRPRPAGRSRLAAQLLPAAHRGATAAPRAGGGRIPAAATKPPTIMSPSCAPPRRRPSWSCSTTRTLATSIRFDVPGKQSARVRFSSARSYGELSLVDINLEPYEVLIAELV